MKFSKRYAGVLMAMLLMLAMGQAWAADLHAVLVGDTQDESIGASVALDIKKVESELNTIAKHTGLKLKVTKITGSQLSKSRVQQAIRGLGTGWNDTIVFYYSGHGFRTKDKPSHWPFLAIENGLDYDWVISNLVGKGSRMVLTLVDACNNVIQDRPSTQRTFGSPTEEAYRELFLNFSGRITATASTPGQYAWGNTKHGGLFTNQFLDVLHSEATKSKSPKWDAIMQKAASTISIFGVGAKQDPVYEIETWKVNPPTTIPVVAAVPTTQKPTTTRRVTTTRQPTTTQIVTTTTQRVTTTRRPTTTVKGVQRSNQPDCRPRPNADLQRCDFSHQDLARADFQKSKLDGVNFYKANLKNALFNDASCQKADFSKANLHDASFVRAYCPQAKFKDADLTKANFKEANINKANFKDADIRNANFKKAKARKTNFNEAKQDSGANFEQLKR